MISPDKPSCGLYRGIVLQFHVPDSEVNGAGSLVEAWMGADSDRFGLAVVLALWFCASSSSRTCLRIISSSVDRDSVSSSALVVDGCPDSQRL